jgi:hypothetical protein
LLWTLDTMIREPSGQDRPLSKPAVGRPWRRWLSGGAIALAVIAGIGYVVRGWLGAERSVDRARIRIATVERGTLVRDVVADGRVVAASSPTLYAIAAGTVDFHVRAGDQVMRGQSLATIASPELQSRLTQEHNRALVPSVIITRGLAERWFPGQSAVGKAFYVAGKEPQTIVGVIDTLARPNDQTAERSRYAVVVPIRATYRIGGEYLLRTDPSRKSEVLAAVEATLNKVSPNRIILERQTFAEVRQNFFRADRAMAYLLVGVSLALLIITALGVVGLASFWVQQRTRQIGVRRALGATRGDILRYFQMENFILATIGIVLGMALAYGINLWLMQKYQVARLPAGFLPIGAGLLWILGQIAVLGPALRASLIPPAIATRTV